MNPDRWRRTAARGVGLWETASRGATYNPMSPSVIQNPYKVYAELRRRSPAHRSAILGSWVLTRYEDVVAAAKDHELLLEQSEVARNNNECAATGPR